MPERFTFPSGKGPIDPERLIDTKKRYDVYCTEQGQATRVHRNVLFKNGKYLSDVIGEFMNVLREFVELEQSNGQSVFIARHQIMFFCEHGTDLTIEYPPKPKE